MSVTCIIEAGDGVGESIVYDEAAHVLVWVDIAGRRITRLDLSTEQVQRWPVDDFPTSIGLRRDGGAVVGLSKRLALFDFDTLTPFAEIEPDRPNNRLNEGRVDPQGRFMVGTMQNNLTPEGTPKEMTEDAGALHLVEADGTVRALTLHEYGITNTMVWLDGRFIVADTLANTLYAYDHDAATGTIADRRIFASGFERGLPDGSCMDAEGFIWNARFGGGCLVRFGPDGTVDRVVDLPCTNPTSCTFGGRDFSTLYVTSARFTLPAGRIAEAPWEGGLFAVDTGVAGRPEPRFAG